MFKNETVFRLFAMYTNINLFGIVLYPWLLPAFRDLVRASTLLILAAVATTWLSGKAGVIHVELFNSFASLESSRDVPDGVKQLCVLFFDALFHVLPIFLVGLPRSPVSVAVACGLLLAWYALVRHRIHTIYAPSVPADQSIACATIVAVALAGCLKKNKEKRIKESGKSIFTYAKY